MVRMFGQRSSAKSVTNKNSKRWKFLGEGCFCRFLSETIFSVLQTESMTAPLTSSMVI